MTDEILTNSQEKHNRIRVHTTCNCKTTVTGLVVPKGTIGTVIDYRYTGKIANDFVIDFGLSSVCILPPDSPLIAIGPPPFEEVTASLYRQYLETLPDELQDYHRENINLLAEIQGGAK